MESSVTGPAARVAEFLRQWRMGKDHAGYTEEVIGVYRDPKAEMADLTVADLEYLVNVARLASAFPLGELPVGDSRLSPGAKWQDLRRRLANEVSMAESFGTRKPRLSCVSDRERLIAIINTFLSVAYHEGYGPDHAQMLQIINDTMENL